MWVPLSSDDALSAICVQSAALMTFVKLVTALKESIYLCFHFKIVIVRYLICGLKIIINFVISFSQIYPTSFCKLT